MFIYISNIYRHDNIPHKRWWYVKTFPKHFHDGSEGNVCESLISDEPANVIRVFLAFARWIVNK
ncbi:MAG: toxin-antitoxin system TumE family protein [Methanosarcinales archaeon]